MTTPIAEDKAFEKLAAVFQGTAQNCQTIVDILLRKFFTHPPRVKVRFVEDWTLNAYAACESESNEVGLHSGVIPRLLKPFADCLANGCIAAVKDRQRLHNWLLNVAVEFLVFHEVGHIVLGHLKYYGPRALFEFRSEEIDETGALDLQAVELMADEFAVAAVLGYRFSGEYTDECGIAEFSDPSVYEHAYLFAIGMLFLILTPLEDFTRVATTSDHPHPEFRNMLIWAELYTDRPQTDASLAKRIIVDLAKMPDVLGIPEDAFVGTHWSADPDKLVPPERVQELAQMFERLTTAVQRMRLAMEGYQLEGAGDDSRQRSEVQAAS